jgi:hypothetical protein
MEIWLPRGGSCESIQKAPGGDRQSLSYEAKLQLHTTPAPPPSSCTTPTPRPSSARTQRILVEKKSCRQRYPTPQWPPHTGLPATCKTLSDPPHSVTLRRPQLPRCPSDTTGTLLAQGLCTCHCLRSPCGWPPSSPGALLPGMLLSEVLLQPFCVNRPHPLQNSAPPAPGSPTARLVWPADPIVPLHLHLGEDFHLLCLMLDSGAQKSTQHGEAGMSGGGLPLSTGASAPQKEPLFILGRVLCPIPPSLV